MSWIKYSWKPPVQELLQLNCQKFHSFLNFVRLNFIPLQDPLFFIFFHSYILLIFLEEISLYAFFTAFFFHQLDYYFQLTVLLLLISASQYF